MATQYYNKKEQFLLDQEQAEILISVVTGNGQGGSYVVFKENKILGANEVVSGGMSDECVDKQLKVIVTIQDKLAQTNWTNATLSLKQGAHTADYFYAEELPNDWDTACYIIKVKMKRE
ncbi:hypothetical protein [Flavobacterium sp.]|uniref:hypothetical protein n=1 Tax=Flavobacterium sp. TaxID=239 RepID=UPI0039E4676D